MANSESKNVGKPDETRKFDKGHIDLVNIGGGSVGKAMFEPGWRWSRHVKPIAKTDWCEAPHFMYQISGRMHVKMSDGQEFEMGPGDVVRMGAGHDAWVVGDEPVVAIDWQGATNYAKG